MSIESIKARLSRVSKGKWSVYHLREDQVRGIGEFYRYRPNDLYSVRSSEMHVRSVVEFGTADDAAFIAHARQDIPALLKVVEAVKELEVDPWETYAYSYQRCRECFVDPAYAHLSTCRWQALQWALEELEELE